MSEDEDIIKLLEHAEAKAHRALAHGVIISPAAIGDCLLMLPLAAFMKEHLNLGGVDFIGHTDYIDFYPGRTVINAIRSIEMMELHRLFVCANDFVLADGDALITDFSRYEWIVSFLGSDHAHFESNLIFTVNCSRSAQVTMLPLTAPSDFSGHISDFYIQRFASENSLPVESAFTNRQARWLVPSGTDIGIGKDQLNYFGFDIHRDIVIIHPGSGGLHKCWHIDNFCTLAQNLIDTGLEVLFLLGPAEHERFSEKQLSVLESLARCLFEPDIGRVLQLISCAGLYIGNDSGLTHLAGCSGTRTLALFGPTNPHLYAPIGPNVRLFTASVSEFSHPAPASVAAVTRLALELLRS